MNVKDALFNLDGLILLNPFRNQPPVIGADWPYSSSGCIHPAVRVPKMPGASSPSPIQQPAFSL